MPERRRGARVLAARWIQPRPGEWLEDGGVRIVGGRVERLLRGRAAVRRAARAEGGRCTELGDLVLTPGLVDAHAHLELSGLAGELPRRGGFRAWIGRLLELRSRRGPARLARDARAGLARLLAGGATTVGDIDSTGALPAALTGTRGPAPRAVRFRELLDASDPARTAAALERVRTALPRRARLGEGLSPHAPYTCSPALLAAAARLARRRGIPVAVHWAETPEEGRWLREGEGPLAAILGASPRRAGLDLLDEAGLLGPHTALVHGNHPARGEPRRIAERGATVVHCPGCHAFFGRPPFPWRRYRDAGVRLALGTDSLASNEELDMRREMALLRAAAPGLAPAAVWAMATTGAARAVGLAGRVGELVPGAHGDLLAHRLPAGAGGAGTRGARAGRELLEALTAEQLPLAGVWIGGRRLPRAEGPESCFPVPPGD